MKNKIVMICCATLMMCSMVACGQKDTPSQSDEPAVSAQNDSDTVLNEEETVDEPESIDEDITMDSLRSHKENSEADFEIAELDEGTCTIDRYIGSSNVAVVPETIDGMKVVEISKMAFANNETLTAIRFPDTVETIGYGACGNCIALKYVICGAGTKTVERAAFINTDMQELELNEGLETIGEGIIFGSTDDWSLELTIPESVTSINSVGTGDITLHVKAGSAAEQAAIDHNYNYVTY